MKDFKFRVFRESDKKMLYFGLHEIDKYFLYTIGESFEESDRIMQFTGLKDGKGKEVYCGDILGTEDGQRGTVQWFSDSFIVSPSMKNTQMSGIGLEYCLSVLDARVIGNTYENE